MSKEKQKHKDLQEIYLELAYLRAKMDNVSNQMQELREAIRESSYQDKMLRMREPYEHPWYKHHGQGSVSGGDSTQPTPKEYSATVTARYGVSGTATTAQGSSN